MAASRCPKCGSARVQRGFNDAPLVLRMIGVCELLCNNCNAEFRGFALPGTVSRSRSHKIELAKHGNVDRRQRAQRFVVRIPVKVHLLDSTAKGAPLSILDGYTRNISTIGFAIILPEARFTDDNLSSERRRIRVLFDIEPRTLIVDATIVRYEQLDEENAIAGWLIGGRVTRLNETDRARLTKFLNIFNAG